MVEIIPKPSAKLPLWQNILFYFSISFLLVTILAYFILSHSLKKSEISLFNLEETLAEGKTTERDVLEKEVLDYQKKINAFSNLLSNHSSSLRFFDFIEKNSHPKIWYQKISLNPDQATAELKGQTENFATLYQQLLILKSAPLVKNVSLSQISIGKEGKVEFNLNINFDPILFK